MKGNIGKFSRFLRRLPFEIVMVNMFTTALYSWVVLHHLLSLSCMFNAAILCSETSEIGVTTLDFCNFQCT